MCHDHVAFILWGGEGLTVSGILQILDNAPKIFSKLKKKQIAIVHTKSIQRRFLS